jgi:hypothetical protein
MPGIEIDAALVATGLALETGRFRELMRAGRIRSLCERGTGSDEGLYRLTFYYGPHRFRVLTDGADRIEPMA